MTAEEETTGKGVQSAPDDPPGAPETPVLTWTSRADPSAIAVEAPDVAVYADGRVRVSERFGAGTPSEGWLSQEDLGRLLAFVLDDNDFCAIDGAALAQAVAEADERLKEKAAAAGTVLLAGKDACGRSGTTLLTVDQRGRRHRLRFDGLFAAARDHPHVAALKRLRAIELRLLALAESVAAGIGS